MIIKIKQQWDFHKCCKYIKYENDDVVYSFTLFEFGNTKLNDIGLEGVYIQPEYRGKGLFYELMNYVFDETKQYDNIWIVVRKRSFIEKKYKKLGFKFYCIKDKKFSWYRKEIVK